MEQASPLKLINDSIQQLHLLISQVAIIYQKLSEYKVDQAAAGDIEDATQKEVEKLKDEYMAISKDLREKMESLESRLSQEKVDKDVDNLRETRDKFAPILQEAYAKSRKLKLILDRCYQLRFISSSVLAASESK